MTKIKFKVAKIETAASHKSRNIEKKNLEIKKRIQK